MRSKVLRGRGRSENRPPRRGMAAVELAFLLPLLVFACMAAVDFARVVYAMVSLQNCARNGALYEFYKAAGYQLPQGWTSLTTAVQADAGNLNVSVPSSVNHQSNPYSPQLSTDNYVTVTVQAPFVLLTLGSNSQFPSMSGTLTLTQSVSMPMPSSTGPVP